MWTNAAVALYVTRRVASVAIGLQVRLKEKTQRKVKKTKNENKALSLHLPKSMRSFQGSQDFRLQFGRVVKIALSEPRRVSWTRSVLSSSRPRPGSRSALGVYAPSSFLLPPSADITTLTCVCCLRAPQGASLLE